MNWVVFWARARRSARLVPVAALLALGACSQQTVTVQLHPLQQSGDVTYVCRVAPGLSAEGAGVPLSECNAQSIARGERDLYALVTQTSTGEVAVINVPYDLRNPQTGEGIVDVDLATPGFGFLPIGALPGDIVTTPGGFASFVGVGEAGKPGIFALPTTELSAPKMDPGWSPRDITDWPACSLPAVPGSIAVVVEPPAADRTVFTSCDHTEAEALPDVSDPMSDPLAGTLARERGVQLGRRKLLVSLPDRGELVVIDAQKLLDSGAGSFGVCDIERRLPLGASLPAAPEAQVLPDDLSFCPDAFAPPQPPAKTSFHATPAGFALADDGMLYVADSTAPLVHAVNASDPCALSEVTPLYTRSLENAARTVTTSRLAVSPLTPSAKRFVYAIDQFDWPTASLMVFDVSPGSTDRTPIVRPGVPLVPSESPDRIQFNGSPRDVAFVQRDRPEVDPATGTTAIGELCDPDPAHTGSVGSLYRTSADYTTGARALELRGVFASVLLTDGQVTFIDVEDFDAPCRRPSSLNPSAVEDFRGCKGDPAGIAKYEDANGPTVSDEVSCRMVEPHRARSSNLGITSSTVGIRAPSLRTFPQLKAPDTAPPGNQEERPKLLGVDFPGVGSAEPIPAVVYVGSTLYTRSRDPDAANIADALVLDPRRAERHSVVLPFIEPRAYASANDLSLTYEGAITGNLPGGFLSLASATPPPGIAAGGVLLLRDPTVGYCDSGVNDIALMKDVGTELGVDPQKLDDFARDHADFVVITADFPADTDGYWSDSPVSRADCEKTFGKFDDKQLSDEREFTILDAQQQLLSLTPAGGRESGGQRTPLDAAAGAALAELATHCFPAGSSYLIRASDQWVLRGSASGFRHKIVAAWRKDGDSDYLECVTDCNPRKLHYESRVFEINPKSSKADFCVPKTDEGVTLDEPASRCIHDTPTERFAVYRGTKVSYRDMTFNWQTIGGFSNLRIDLRTVSGGVSPQNMVGLSEFNWLTVVDAASLGLALVSLDTLAPLTPTLY